MLLFEQGPDVLQFSGSFISFDKTSFSRAKIKAWIEKLSGFMCLIRERRDRYR